MKGHFIPNMEIENAKVLFRNFSGKEKKDPHTGAIRNREGARNFCIVIEDEELALKLKADQWDIQTTNPSEEYPDVLYYLPVHLRYDNYPPVAHLMNLSTHSRKELNEASVGMLDKSNTKIVYAHLILSPSYWDVNGKTGVKCYLKEGLFYCEVSKIDNILEDWQEEV